MSNAALKRSLPPMLIQYRDYKARYPDSVILFQVGDFYEIFFEDAVTVSKALNLTLTSRDRNDPHPIPMCGVPVGVIEGYLERLVALGFSVALISQVGEPTGKGMVERRLERVVTPGIRILGAGNSEKNNIAAIEVTEDGFSLAFCDVQEGKVWVRDVLPLDQLSGELGKVEPKEVVCHSAGRSSDIRKAWVREVEAHLRLKLKWRSTEYVRGEYYPNLPGISTLSPSSKRVTQLLLKFIEETTISAESAITSVALSEDGEIVAMDSTTRSNLELVRNLRGGNEGTLFSALDRTVTQVGSRVLKEWILNPLTKQTKIIERHESVECLIGARDTRIAIRELLSGAPDVERIAVRLKLEVVGPRELGAVRDLLQKTPIICEHLKKIDLKGCLHECLKVLDTIDGISEKLETFLADSLPNGTAEGGIVKDGYNAEVDRFRKLRNTGASWISEFEQQEREKTGIGSLKVKFNQVLGYFIETTLAQAGKVPSEYVRRQSTANSERFFVSRLKEMEEQIVGAESKQIVLERALYEEFRRSLIPFVNTLREISRVVGILDVLLNFSTIAEDEGYARPEISTSGKLSIIDGRHPVLAQILRQDLIANSIECGGKKPVVWLVTGPNMGGKSTFLRQNALICIMAQMGSYIPATEAIIGIVDRIFARIGATDNLYEGESTFMVEMREAAHIVRTATSRSLVIIDELGRGTATADGLAIAQGVVEWLTLKIKSRTLFATHFHELTKLERRCKGIGNLSVGCVDTEDGVLFTHKIAQGPADRSYGIEVARRAGLPRELLKRAQNLLVSQKVLDSENADGEESDYQIPLFEESSKEDYALSSWMDRLRQLLRTVQPDDLSPREALDLVYELKRLQAG